ncbi:MAG TPA: hypothetical protein VHZ03_14565 [Trebonia sp.]|jgi:hypothetical protein|nr:hypothetical protein [Trebonia sp.]
MRVVSWGRTWTVGRGEVRSVLLADEAFSLSVMLADGSVIRPIMFMASPLGVGYFRAGLFRNSMSRETITRSRPFRRCRQLAGGGGSG